MNSSDDHVNPFIGTAGDHGQLYRPTEDGGMRFAIRATMAKLGIQTNSRFFEICNARHDGQCLWDLVQFSGLYLHVSGQLTADAAADRRSAMRSDSVSRRTL